MKKPFVCGVTSRNSRLQYLEFWNSADGLNCVIVPDLSLKMDVG